MCWSFSVEYSMKTSLDDFKGGHTISGKKELLVFFRILFSTIHCDHNGKMHGSTMVAEWKMAL